jgi:hypothetical protein
LKLEFDGPRADLGDVVIDFDQFFDGENLLQEDLVVWFNLG